MAVNFDIRASREALLNRGAAQFLRSPVSSRWLRHCSARSGELASYTYDEHGPTMYAKAT
jgi:hypothetical protein